MINPVLNMVCLNLRPTKKSLYTIHRKTDILEILIILMSVSSFFSPFLDDLLNYLCALELKNESEY